MVKGVSTFVYERCEIVYSAPYLTIIYEFIFIAGEKLRK